VLLEVLTRLFVRAVERPAVVDVSLGAELVRFGSGDVPALIEDAVESWRRANHDGLDGSVDAFDRVAVFGIHRVDRVCSGADQAGNSSISREDFRGINF
jgi:hypothetical protein